MRLLGTLIAALIVAVPATSLAAGGPKDPADTAELVAGANAAQLKQEQAANAAKMPRDIEARRASARKFAHLSRTEAADVAKETSPEVLRTPGWPKLSLLPGQTISMEAANRARIVNPDGTANVAVSTLPLGFPTKKGHPWQPTNLDLRATDAGYQAEATPVPLTIPSHIDDPILLGSGDEQLQILPEVTAPAAGVRQDTGVFYANVDTDTDLFVKPVLGGVETYNVLRSGDSPEAVSFALRNPRGGADPQLVADADRGGAAVMTDGGSIAHISQAKAWDADHQPVPVTMSFDGPRLTLHVAHRGADFAYPITVDPTTVPDKYGACWQYVAAHNGCEIDLWETEYYTDYGSGLGAGWSYSDNDPNGLIDGFFSTNTAYLGMGLTIQERGYNHFENGEGGNWFLRAPGEVQIYEVGFINVSTDNWDNNSCAFTGIRRSDLTFETGPQWVGGCAGQTLDASYLHCTNINCQPGGSASYGNSAWFGSVTNQGPAWGWTHAFTHVVGGVTILMHDYIAPRLSVADPGGSDAVQVTLGDFGLGMKSWSIYSNGNLVDGWDDNAQPAGVPRCSGGVTRFVCPHDVVRWPSRCEMHTGTNLLAINAVDVSGNELASNVGVYVDPSVIGFSLSGDMASADGQTLQNRKYALHVDAHAPCGINEIAVRLDGQDVLPYNFTSSRDEIIDVDKLAPGMHTVRIDARGRNSAGAASASWMGARVINFTKVQDGDPVVLDTEEDNTLQLRAYVDRSGSAPTAEYISAFQADKGTSIGSQPPGVLPQRDSGAASVSVPLTTPNNRWLGMSDQKVSSVTDPRFTALNVPYRRLIVPYDVVVRANPSGFDPGGNASCNPSKGAESNENLQWADALPPAPDQAHSQVYNKQVENICKSLRDVDQWMAANNGVTTGTTAGGQQAEPLVSFGHSYADASYYQLLQPSATYYRAAIHAFRARYPSVRYFTPWNEPNNRDQPWRTDPNGAADRLIDMLDECTNPPHCFVLAGDFADGTPYLANGKPNTKNFDEYVTRYQSRFAERKVSDYIGPWAMHLHSSVQDRGVCPENKACFRLLHGSRTKLDALLKATKAVGWPGALGPPVWITEVGAITAMSQGDSSFFSDEARVENSFLNAITMAASNPRIKRMYYYHLIGNGSSDPDAAGNLWDSGLLAPVTQAPRQLYDWYKWIAEGDVHTPHVVSLQPNVTSATTASFTFSSDSPPSAGYRCSLDMSTWSACTSPMTYNGLAAGEHTFNVQAMTAFSSATSESSFTGVGAVGRGSALDGAPSNLSASTSWTVDVEAPDTSISSGPSGPTSSTSASFVLAGTDDVAVTAYECQLDGASWSTCTSPQTYTGLAAGAHELKVRAMDGSGKMDTTPATTSWSVDVLPPETSIVSSPSSLTAVTTATITFTGTDDTGVTSYECQVDGGAWGACTSPKAYSALGTGSHTVGVRAGDTAGNVDPTPATATWTVDATAPNTTISSGPSAMTSSTSASIAFSGTDNVAVFSYECQLDAGSWAACTSPKAYSSLAAGAHTVKVRAMDSVGNVDDTPASVAWTIDNTAPNTSITTTPPSPTKSTSASVAFSGTDDVGVASYECQLDAGSWAACSSPQAYTSLAGGIHTVKVRAKDSAGNLDGSPSTAAWTVDSTPPDTTISSAPSGSTTATSASIAFSGSDNLAVASYECQLDGSAWAACTSPKAYNTLAAGSHTVAVRAIDTAGNADGTPASAAWTITATSGSVVLGNQTVESFSDYNPAFDVEAFPYTATGGGPAASISLYLESGSTGAVTVGLYGSSGGRPTKLLASGTLSSPTAGGWNTFALNGRPVIVSGTTYQLTIQSATGGIKFRDRLNGPCTSRAVSPGSNVMPEYWPRDIGSWSTCPASMYLTTGSADTTAPDTSITSQPTASTTSTSASFAFTGTDDNTVREYECQLDSGAWLACSSPRGYAGATVGSHTFKVRAKDAAGNVDTTPASYTWTIASGGAGPTVLAGNAIVEGLADSIGVGEGEAWPFTASASGIAGVISVYLDSSSTSSDLQVALYGNGSGKPGTLLASGTTSGQSTGGWVTVALSGSAAITSGTTYWLGVLSSNPTLVIRDRQSGICTAHGMATPLGAFPGTWGTDVYTGTECPPSMTLKTS